MRAGSRSPRDQRPCAPARIDRGHDFRLLRHRLLPLARNDASTRNGRDDGNARAGIGKLANTVVFEEGRAP